MNRDIDNSGVNMICEFISYKFRLFKYEVLFERVVTVVFCMTIILVGACSLSAEANAQTSSDESEQNDPFSAKGIKAGDRVVKVVDGMEFAFRWCPLSAESQNDRDSDNQQSRSQGFWIMETEVTVGMFRAFVKDTGYEPSGDTPLTVIFSSEFSDYVNFGMKEGISWDKPGFEQNDRHPVTCVSWVDADAFNKWLAGKLNKNVLLPTEEQWLCACRAGAAGAISDDLDEVAWYWKNSSAVTHPVGTKKPNAWGLFDTLGNVWEWCSNERSGNMRTRRGCGYGVKSQLYSYEHLLSNKKSFRCSDVGFRCALIPDPVPLDFGIGAYAGERKVFSINGVEFAFRWCPPGTFTMGSPESEEGRKSDEVQHQVTLTKGFWMMETEVTVEQWEAIMGKNSSRVRGQNRPVAIVSWEDCQLFCYKSYLLGLNIQLPTEAQWEYACRAGTTDAYADEINEIGWTKRSFSPGEPRIPRMVRMKMPNEWGLYDMHGNVYEWCSDWYGNYPHENVTDPEGPKSGTHRVMRGGCSCHEPIKSRSANRGKCVPDYNQADFLGFRCVTGKRASAPSVTKTSVQKPDSQVTRIPKFDKGRKAGERKTCIVKGVEFAFRWCPPGTFMMGSPQSEKGRGKDELQHEVTLTKGFWIMEKEVSEEQWVAIMNAYNPSKYQKFAKTGVFWEKYGGNCQNFCQKSSEIGLPLQLPTEAQWEYACRAGTTGAYAGELDEMAWYQSNSGERKHSCGKKKPNAWGIYDMHGNVWEWCYDWYGDYPSESVTDPTGPESGTVRVIRGGGWVYSSERCRSACRDNYNPCVAWDILGFRCVIIPKD